MKLLRRAGWTLACALLVCFLQSFFRQPVSLALAVAVVALVVATTWRPYAALLVIAGLGPLSTIIFSLGRAGAGAVQFAETMVLAFLTGWTAHRALTGVALNVPPAVRGAALLLALAAAASGCVHWFGLRAGLPDVTLRELLQWYVNDYAIRTPGIEPIAGAVVFASGMLLVLAAADICGGSSERRRVALLVLVVAAAVAAAYTVRRLVQLSAVREDALAAFVENFVNLRVNVHYGDRNAAGSYYALALLLGLGLAATHRVIALMTLPLIGAGLWISGSRVALAAAFAAMAVFTVAALHRAGSRGTRALAVLALITVVGGAAALYQWYPARRNFAAPRAYSARIDLARAGIQMAADEPLFGVGLSRYYVLSNQYAGETLAKLKFSRENAHNNFVQVLAELGAPGFVGFLVLLGGSLRLALQSEKPRPLHVTALVAGLGAYLLTCLGGHPLVVPEAAYPFWLALGLAAAPMGTALAPMPRRWRIATSLLALGLVATIPWRAAHAVRNADLEHVSTGFSLWQQAPDGTRFRWMGGRATFYVASTAGAVRIPFRSGITIRRSLEVTVLLDGREANRLWITADDQWRTLRLPLVGDHAASFTRVDLVLAEPGAPPLDVVATQGDGLVMVGRPEIEHATSGE